MCEFSAIFEAVPFDRLRRQIEFTAPVTTGNPVLNDFFSCPTETPGGLRPGELTLFETRSRDNSRMAVARGSRENDNHWYVVFWDSAAVISSSILLRIIRDHQKNGVRLVRSLSQRFGQAEKLDFRPKHFV